jgi:5-methylcytosine-specific restriction endonuclease McrA
VSRQKEYYEKNKERIIERVLAKRRANLEEYREYNRTYQRAYKERNRERVRENDRKWAVKRRLEGRSKKNAQVAARKARKLRATPLWADIREIERFYQDCPPGMQVDHIVPLQGKTVCGLHVEYNLQYLTRSENAAKGNRIDWRPATRG